MSLTCKFLATRHLFWIRIQPKKNSNQEALRKFSSAVLTSTKLTGFGSLRNQKCISRDVKFLKNYEPKNEYENFLPKNTREKDSTSVEENVSTDPNLIKDKIMTRSSTKIKQKALTFEVALNVTKNNQSTSAPPVVHNLYSSQQTKITPPSAPSSNSSFDLDLSFHNI